MLGFKQAAHLHQAGRIYCCNRKQGFFVTKAFFSTGNAGTYDVARSLKSKSLAVLVASSILLASPVSCAEEQDVVTSPYLLQDSIEFGVDPQTGSLRACPSNINPNCVSTRSTNDTYGPAWRATEKDAKKAAEELEDAVAELFEPRQYQLLSRSSDAGGEYRAFGFASALGDKPDVAEFYIKNGGVTDRNWEGDSPGVLVTYRSIAGQVRYLWPISQPISDFGVQRGRLFTIRRALGWSVIGCEADVAECSQIDSTIDLSLKGQIKSRLSLLGS